MDTAAQSTAIAWSTVRALCPPFPSTFGPLPSQQGGVSEIPLAPGLLFRGLRGEGEAFAPAVDPEERTAVGLAFHKPARISSLMFLSVSLDNACTVVRERPSLNAATQGGRAATDPGPSSVGYLSGGTPKPGGPHLGDVADTDAGEPTATRASSDSGGGGGGAQQGEDAAGSKGSEASPSETARAP